jgi:hypothetical protein
MNQAKEIIPWVALVISSLAFFVSWRSYSLTKRSALHKRPYLNERGFSQLDVVILEGPEKEHWEITAIRLLWPFHSRLMRKEVEYDLGGSISKSWFVDIGRKLESPDQPLIVSPSDRRSFALVSASSKMRPRISQRWVIRINIRD